MKTKNTALVLVLGLAGSVVCLAKDANLGTWKLNEANSRSSPGASKNLTVVYKASRGDMKVIVDGTDADGKPTHNEWSGKFDGKDYPVTGDSTSDTRAYKKMDNSSQLRQTELLHPRTNCQEGWKGYDERVHCRFPGRQESYSHSEWDRSEWQQN